MKRLFFIAIAGIGLLARPAFAQRNADSPTDAQVLELLEVSGGRANAEQTLRLMVDAMPSNVPDRFKQLLVAEISVDSLIRPLVAVHQKYYTANDVAQLIAFYKSPLGMKVVQVTPSILEASMNNGRGYGERAAQRAYARYQAEQAAPANDPPAPKDGR